MARSYLVAKPSLSQQADSAPLGTRFRHENIGVNNNFILLFNI